MVTKKSVGTAAGAAYGAVGSGLNFVLCRGGNPSEYYNTTMKLLVPHGYVSAKIADAVVPTGQASKLVIACGLPIVMTTTLGYYIGKHYDSKPPTFFKQPYKYVSSSGNNNKCT